MIRLRLLQEGHLVNQGVSMERWTTNRIEEIQDEN